MAPVSALSRGIKDSFEFRSIKKRHRKTAGDFETLVSGLQTTTNWFGTNKYTWANTLDKCGLREDMPIKALEIGSWEGLSSFYMLQKFKNIKLFCADTWQGSDEHADPDQIMQVERNFDANIAKYADSVTKCKGTSYSFFEKYDETDFDLIYIDGSHHCDDVMMDAIKSFERLKIGGLMIFDDYLWRYYREDHHNPAFAINAFLRMKKGNFRIAYCGYQLMIQKTAGSDERRQILPAV
jgi:predicted O-methyltransferase YrrM